jgi:hypothetical protein
MKKPPQVREEIAVTFHFRSGITRTKRHAHHSPSRKVPSVDVRLGEGPPPGISEPAPNARSRNMKKIVLCEIYTPYYQQESNWNIYITYKQKAVNFTLSHIPFLEKEANFKCPAVAESREKNDDNVHK